MTPMFRCTVLLASLLAGAALAITGFSEPWLSITLKTNSGTELSITTSVDPERGNVMKSFKLKLHGRWHCLPGSMFADVGDLELGDTQILTSAGIVDDAFFSSVHVEIPIVSVGEAMDDKSLRRLYIMFENDVYSEWGITRDNDDGEERWLTQTKAPKGFSDRCRSGGY